MILVPRTGNFTEPLLALIGLILTVCTLTGEWWLLGYAILGTGFLGLATLYSVYLEYNTQRILEQRRAKVP